MAPLPWPSCTGQDYVHYKSGTSPSGTIPAKLFILNKITIQVYCHLINVCSRVPDQSGYGPLLSGL